MRALLTALPTLASATLAIATPAMAAPDPAFGEWLTDEGLARVAVGPCSYDPSKACGAVTWLKDPVGHPSRDIHNPDPAQRGRPLVGILVVKDMRPEAPGRWSGGRVYEPQTGRTANGRMRALVGNRLEIVGCILVVCDGEIWTRASEGAAGS